MSTRSTLFLTSDNEHCYYECSSQHRDDEGNFIGYDIELEIDKKNVSNFYEDEEGYSITIPPGSEIYSLIERMDIEHPKPVEQPTRAELIRDLKIVKKQNAELLEKLTLLKERLERLDRNTN
ncbi:hypothetical protein PFY12_14515 [Chryseobacterium camelliae]|uniref:Uncharacterized protein n=1 Tax=Chryseobacterium camelliae TaxID=1265445 RepID=A0ABY7QLY4_9FLAO|nr:hypothetical protein [Chryseobacterium camelliae]WBV60238.1 hypothetical protein PFY12_14515 [Chryseobacterium camelliae]